MRSYHNEYRQAENDTRVGGIKINTKTLKDFLEGTPDDQLPQVLANCGLMQTVEVERRLSQVIDGLGRPE